VPIGGLRKRDTPTIPAYAEPCSGAVGYVSACSCLGVFPTTVSLPTPIATTTDRVSVTSSTSTETTIVTTLSQTTVLSTSTEVLTSLTTTTSVAATVSRVPLFKIIGNLTGTDTSQHTYNIINGYVQVSGPGPGNIRTISLSDAANAASTSDTFYWDSSTGWIYDVSLGSDYVLATFNGNIENVRIVERTYGSSFGMTPMVCAIAAGGVITCHGPSRTVQYIGAQNNVLWIFDSPSQMPEYNALPVTLKAKYSA
jgi:hypothetical protein